MHETKPSKHFDFYANAQYPLIMKQQTINDAVLKDLFGRHPLGSRLTYYGLCYVQICK